MDRVKVITPLPTASALLLIISVIISVQIPLYGFWVGDNGSRDLQIRAIIEQRKFTGFYIDSPFPEQDPLFLTRSATDLQLFNFDGKVFTQYPPAFPYLVAIFYQVIGSYSYRLVPILGLFGIFASIVALSKFYFNKRQPWVALLAVLATPVFPYAFTLWDVLPAAALGLSAWYFLASGLQTNRTRDFICASVTGLLAIVLREEYILFLFVSGITALLVWKNKRPRIWIFVCFSAFGIALLAFWNYRQIGHYFFSQIWSNLPDPTSHKRMSWTLSNRANVLHDLFANFSNVNLLNYPVLILMTATAIIASRIRGDKQVYSFLLLLTLSLIIHSIHWSAGFNLVIQTQNISFVVLTPLIWIGIAAWNRRNSMEMRFLQISSMLFVVCFAAITPPVSAAGLHFGPRLLMAALPLLFVIGVHAVNKASSLANKSIMYFFIVVYCIIGLVDNGFYIVRLIHKKQISAEHTELIRRLPRLPLFNTIDWIPIDYSHVFYERPMLGVNENQLTHSIQIARNINPERGLIIRSQANLPELFEKQIHQPRKILQLNAFSQPISVVEFEWRSNTSDELNPKKLTSI